MIIELEGCKIEALDQCVYETDLKPGDTYIAWSNSRDRWNLLTCQSVKYGANRCDNANEKFFCSHHPEKGHPSFIIPQENAYCFDAWMARKVISIDGQKV